jgi:hypothetical protein
MTEWALIAVLATASPTVGVVHGTIESDPTSEPIVGVRVTVGSIARAATSDSSGSYALGDLPPGRHQLTFAQFGYYDLTVEVVVPEGGALRLDVRLRPRPITMPAISVLAAPGERTGGSFEDMGPLPPGSRIVSTSGLEADPLTRERDPMLSLDAVPGITIAEESPTAFHARGGSADQNQILLDGIPVYNAYHTSGVLAGVNPDAVSTVAVHAGAMPARYGGRLSSVVDLTTPRPGREGFGVRGGFGPADLRTTVETTLPGGGGILVAGRRTTYDLVERGDFDRGATSAFDEALAKTSMPAFGGEFELLALHGTNRLSFFTDAEGDDSEITDSRERYNRVRWSTNTDAITWRGPIGDELEGRVSVWKAGTHSMGEWRAEGRRIHFDHGLEHLGLAAEADWTRPSGSARAGVGIERLATSYATRLVEDEARLDAEDGKDFLADATSLQAFVEYRWIPHDRWLVDNGLRAVVGAGGGADLEPRISIHYRPWADVAFSAGYARAHQYAQSLRNEESALNVAFGFDPLVSAADSRVPIGRSDQVTAAARLRLTEALRLDLDAYARWLDGLVLVAPVTAHPFAVEGFAEGDGTARGIGAALVYRGPRMDLDLVGEWSSSTRRTGALEYRPTFERRRSLAAAAARRLGDRTSVRAALRAAAGRSTSGLESDFQWEPFDRFTGEIEFGGTPLRRSGALNRERLPAYVRLDVGVRRIWRPSLLGIEGNLVTWLEVLNVLGRRNALALQETVGSQGWRQIALSDTSIALGVEWSF